MRSTCIVVLSLVATTCGATCLCLFFVRAFTSASALLPEDKRFNVVLIQPAKGASEGAERVSKRIWDNWEYGGVVKGNGSSMQGLRWGVEGKENLRVVCEMSVHVV